MDGDIRKFLQSRNVDKVLARAELPLQNDSSIKRVEIIVLKYKSPDLESECARRIIQYTKWPYKLNIFDNRGNGPNTSKAWNKLIRESTCDYVLFIDSDAFVFDSVGMVNGERFPDNSGACWVTEMMKAFSMWPNVAIVGPVCGTTGVTTMQSMRPKDMDPFEIDGHLSGYCFLTKKSIYEELGYFDEDFCFYGQESDWIERILENRKHKIVIAPRAHVVHGMEGIGSMAGQQAEREGEMDLGQDASYSYLLWNMKKQRRLNAKGQEYEFKY